MKNEVIKSKDLKPGMHVVCVRAPKRSPLAVNTGIPLTVKVIEYPFIVLEGERREMPSIFSFHTGTGTSTYSVTSTTVHGPKHRWQVVGEDYVAAHRHKKSEPPTEFPSTIGED